jgi:gamma-glutamylcyclotransferase (GGCT)/AIG2-like uncharacterized protein YtfP
LVELGPYPAVVDPTAPDAPPSPGPVFGEVWDLPETSIPELDEFEGCPTLYKRDVVEVEMDDGGRAMPFIYVFATALPKRARVIASGRYERHGQELPDGARRPQLEDE